jgi:hypothetical protein
MTIEDNTGKPLSTIWSNANKEDIGSGFRRARKAIVRDLLKQKKVDGKRTRKLSDVYRRIQYMDFEAEHSGRDRHPFLNGNSRFVFYRIRPPKLRKETPKIDKKIVNLKNKISASQKVKFASTLGANIDLTSKFFLEEILPRSQALMTAMSNVDEVMQQLTDEQAQLPIEFIKAKSREAINLRIIRFLADQYGLTKNEARLMRSEFIAKMTPPLF